MINKRLIKAIHRRLIAEFGGSGGIRDEGLFESALSRPQNRQVYVADCDIFEQAGSLAFGIIKNHPFVDGNKRVAAVACELMIVKEGYEISAGELEKYKVYMLLAAGDMPEKEFIDWLRQNSRKKVN